MKNNEVKEKKSKRKNKRKLSIQKIFNLISFMFILACCIFYGTRFIKLYLENNKTIETETKVLADNIKDDNKNNNNFKNINGNYYFQGTDPNNYLTYSNLTWRIISVNSDDTITVILDKSITSLAAGEEKNYKDSYINIWLNNNDNDYTGILEDNLNETNTYLTFTKTCTDKVSDTSNITCTEKTENTLITVPSLTDYIYTGAQNGFMNNEEYFYLTNTNEEDELWYVDDEGKVGTSDGSYILGIKAIITIKNTVNKVSGSGTKENPYTIEKETGLFGSYVKLGNDIWRIYEINEDNIKLSLNSYLTINNEEITYKYSNISYYHNDTKYGSLAYYLKNTYLESLSYKDIVNEVKYSNGLYNNTTDYDYTKVLNKTIDTRVALLSIGDIILNPTNTNYYTSTGVSANSSQMYIMSNNFKPYTKSISTELKIVPVISIKKDLLTKGEGTLESPLEVQ